MDQFKEVYDAHHRKVFNISLNIVQNSEDAEEITQDVFVEAFRSLSTFEARSSLGTWLYRIAVNKSLDLLRARKRKKRFAFITRLFHPESGEALHEASHFDHPGAELEKKERTRILFEALEGLPEHQKTAFVLSQIEHFPQKETARIMGLSEKAVESLIQRAKANLRKKLGKLYHERRI
ncbi:MAG: RNA polymerase sigma factor [Bacteroidia bacterium]